MNYLDKLIKIIEFHRKKQKINKIKTIGALAVLGVAIGGAVTVIFAHGCCDKIGNTVIRSVEDIDEDINKNKGDDENINKDEIKEALEKVGEESLGDVGVAMD